MIIKPGISYLIATLIALFISLSIDYYTMEKRFNSDVNYIHRLILQKIANIETVLISLVGFHHASDDLNSAEMSSFSENLLKAYPYIHAIITLEKITIKERNNFEKRMHRQGFIQLKLRTANTTTTSKKPFYLPINFIEPMNPLSAKLLGLDLYSSNDFMLLIQRSITHNQVIASKQIQLTRQTKSASLIFKPIYLGRYPPVKAQERIRLLSGLVAVQLNLKQFLSDIDLATANLEGHINQHSQKPHKLSLSSKESFDLYGETLSLTLIRPITPNMFNIWQLLIIWTIAISLLILYKNLLHKRKIIEKKIKRLAYFDSLTNLPNRTSFKQNLTTAIKEGIDKQSSGAVMFMDLDEFKRINDTLGHDIGDELLIQVSNRLSRQMRQNDLIISLNIHSLNNSVTRLGGDEFTILLTDINDTNLIAHVAERIQNSIRQPFILKNHEVCITSSIGIAIFPDDGNNIDQILKHADTAMYHAKERGKNNYQFYSKKMSEQAEQRLKLEAKLRRALERNEFSLYYQPQIDTHSRKIVAAEALIRWNQTELGMIFPDEFIPLAEETGLITDIGAWVIKEACLQSKHWQAQGYDPIRIAVNVSSIQFSQPDFVQVIAHIVRDTQINPQLLEIEITESLMMKNIDETIGIIHQLADIGVYVSIDDFGTGYSSLSYLKKFPIKSLKIDKAFITEIPHNSDDMMITAAIISMAKKLHLKVVAEGVENEPQLQFLKQHQCEFIQGYYIAKPLPKKSFENLLKSR